MPGPYYLKSTATGAANGSSWVDAFTTLTAAAAACVAGDTIYVSQSHAETPATYTTITFPGTVASPVKILCGNDTASPPTISASTAAITAAVNQGTITFNGYIFFQGFALSAGAGVNNFGQFVVGADSHQHYKNCSFFSNTTNSAGSGGISIGRQTGTFNSSRCIWENFNVKFLHASHSITVAGDLRWEGGAVLSGSATPTALITVGGGAALSGGVQVSGVDLSGFGTALNLIKSTTTGKRAHVVFRNCKLPTGWSGSLFDAAVVSPNIRGEMYNCDTGDTNYRMWVEDYTGSVKNETTIVRTGGASDGVTALSWKIASSSNAEFPLLAFESPEIVQWNETTGSSLTATIEVITDNVTLTDAECWMEIQYLGTSGFPLSLFRSDGAGTSGGTADENVLATPVNQTASTETWTTTGLTTPVKQRLSVTFTPQEKGFIHAIVRLAKTSTTVYVDPKLTVA